MYHPEQLLAESSLRHAIIDKAMKDMAKAQSLPTSVMKDLKAQLQARVSDYKQSLFHLEKSLESNQRYIDEGLAAGRDVSNWQERAEGIRKNIEQYKQKLADAERDAVEWMKSQGL